MIPQMSLKSIRRESAEENLRRLWSVDYFAYAVTARTLSICSFFQPQILCLACNEVWTIERKWFCSAGGLKIKPFRAEPNCPLRCVLRSKLYLMLIIVIFPSNRCNCAKKSTKTSWAFTGFTAERNSVSSFYIVNNANVKDHCILVLSWCLLLQLNQNQSK